MAEFLTGFSNILWGAPVLILLGIVGLLYGIRTKFFQIRKMGYILKNTAGEMFKKGGGASGDRGTLTPLLAVCSALAGCVGTANIAGVATAMVVGGPGAVFWMWVIALLGMMTKCVEVTLGQYYRIQGKDGVYYGGPMYYIERGMGKKWKPLAIFFAVTIILGGLGTAAFAQPYTMSTALERTFHIPAWVVTVTAAAICGIVLIGGVKGIGKFCEKITPAMCLIYVVGALGVIIVNIRFVPQAFAAIFKYAFAPMPAIGGLAGSTLALALRQGAARGTFSNEAGCGSSPITHATAITDHPFKEGLYGSFEVFVDTIIVCTMTSLAIMCSAATSGPPVSRQKLLLCRPLIRPTAPRSAICWSPFRWPCSPSPRWSAGRSTTNPHSSTSSRRWRPPRSSRFLSVCSGWFPASLRLATRRIWSGLLSILPLVCGAFRMRSL